MTTNMMSSRSFGHGIFKNSLKKNLKTGVAVTALVLAPGFLTQNAYACTVAGVTATCTTGDDTLIVTQPILGQIQGGDGDDSITAPNGMNQLNATTLISGDAGNDTITINNGTDVGNVTTNNSNLIYGGIGTDTITVTGATNEKAIIHGNIYGGSHSTTDADSADTIRLGHAIVHGKVDTGSDNETTATTAPNDTSDNFPANVLANHDTYDTVHVDNSIIHGGIVGDTGTDHINIADGSTVTSTSGSVISTGSGRDNIEITGNRATTLITGSNVNSNLVGAIDTGADNDRILLRGGTITGKVDTGDGNDMVIVEDDYQRPGVSSEINGNIETGTGEDTLTFSGGIINGDGTANGYAISTGQGNDNVNVTGNGDTGINNGGVGGGLSTGAGNDTITISRGTIKGEATLEGDAAVSAGDGDDYINITNNTTIGSIKGGTGNDSITVGPNGNYAGVTDISGGDGNDNIALNAASQGNEAVASDYKLVEDGATQPNQYGVHGGAGNDNITITNTVVNGEVSTDGIAQSTNKDTATDTNTVTLNDGAVIQGFVDGGAGKDTITLNGTAKIETDNSLKAIGWDSIDTDAGDDRVVINGTASVNAGIFTAADNDTVEINGGTVVARDANTAAVNLGKGNDTYTQTNGTVTGGVATHDGTNTFTISGGTLDGNITGGTGSDTLNISGGTITQAIGLNAGDDTINLSGGNGVNFAGVSVFDGGTGHDTFNISNGITMNANNFTHFEAMNLNSNSVLQAFNLTQNHSGMDLTVTGSTVTMQDGATDDSMTLDTLTINNGSVFQFDVNASTGQADQITVTNGVTSTGTGTVSVNLMGAPASATGSVLLINDQTEVDSQGATGTSPSFNLTGASADFYDLFLYDQAVDAGGVGLAWELATNADTLGPGIITVEAIGGITSVIGGAINGIITSPILGPSFPGGIGFSGGPGIGFPGGPGAAFPGGPGATFPGGNPGFPGGPGTGFPGGPGAGFPGGPGTAGLTPMPINPGNFPQGTVPLPDGNFMLPSGQIVSPSGQIIGSNGQVMGPNGQFVGPNGQIIGPNGQIIGPNGQILGPNGQAIDYNAPGAGQGANDALQNFQASSASVFRDAQGNYIFVDANGNYVIRDQNGAIIRYGHTSDGTLDGGQMAYSKGDPYGVEHLSKSGGDYYPSVSKSGSSHLVPQISKTPHLPTYPAPPSAQPPVAMPKPPAKCGSGSIWGQVFGSNSVYEKNLIDGYAPLSGHTDTTGAIMVGADFDLDLEGTNAIDYGNGYIPSVSGQGQGQGSSDSNCGNSHVGLFGIYANTDSEFDQGDNASVSTYGLGGYGRFQLEDFYFSSALFGGTNDIELIHNALNLTFDGDGSYLGFVGAAGHSMQFSESMFMNFGLEAMYLSSEIDTLAAENDIAIGLGESTIMRYGATAQFMSVLGMSAQHSTVGYVKAGAFYETTETKTAFEHAMDKACTVENSGFLGTAEVGLQSSISNNLSLYGSAGGEFSEWKNSYNGKAGIQFRF